MEESACLEHEELEDTATDSSPLYWPHDAPVICLDKNSINIQWPPLFFFKKKLNIFHTKLSFSKIYAYKVVG